MKNILKFIPVLAIAAVLMTSCLDGSSDYTPSITVTYFTQIATGDTVECHYKYSENGDNGYYYLDTVNVGDTVRFAVGFGTYTNNLVMTSITAADTSVIKVQATSLGSDFVSSLTNASDTASCLYYFNEGYNYVAIPMYIIPQKAGNSKITFYVESDANSEKVTNTSSESVTVYVQ